MGEFAVATWYTGVCRYTAGVAIGTAAGTGFAGATSTAAVWQHNSFNKPRTQEQINTLMICERAVNHSEHDEPYHSCVL